MVKAFEKSDPKRCSAARRVRGKKQFDEIIAVAVAEETLAAVFARAAPWESGRWLEPPIKMKYDDGGWLANQRRARGHVTRRGPITGRAGPGWGMKMLTSEQSADMKHTDTIHAGTINMGSSFQYESYLATLLILENRVI